jgi:hypothetical protein
MYFSLINGTGTAMSGEVAPEDEVLKAHCDNCKEITPFIKKIGRSTWHIFWIPLPSNEKLLEYWECNVCNSFYYFSKPNSEKTK